MNLQLIDEGTDGDTAPGAPIVPPALPTAHVLPSAQRTGPDLDAAVSASRDKLFFISYLHPGTI